MFIWITVGGCLFLCILTSFLFWRHRKRTKKEWAIRAKSQSGIGMELGGLSSLTSFSSVGSGIAKGVVPFSPSEKVHVGKEELRDLKYSSVVGASSIVETPGSQSKSKVNSNRSTPNGLSVKNKWSESHRLAYETFQIKLAYLK